MATRRPAEGVPGAVVGMQVLAILAFAGAREYILRAGQEVVLMTVPVDPTDLFRGDYVALRYEISSLRGYFDVGETVYVPLVRSGDVWVSGEPAREPPTDGDPFIQGRVARSATIERERMMEVEYGIESYFVPEGTASAIEQRRGKLKVRVAVDGWGHGAIKQLLLDN